MSEVVKALAETLEDIVCEEDNSQEVNESKEHSSGRPGSIYNKYGGWPFFHGIIFQLYVELVDHPEISHHFIGVDIEKLSRLQTEFLCQAIGGPQNYQGRPLAGVHKSMGISEFQFAVVAKRFGQIFKNNGLTKEEVKTIMDFVGSHRPQIVTRKIAMIDRVMKPFYEVVYLLRRFLRSRT
jgi:hemoglobin